MGKVREEGRGKEGREGTKIKEEKRWVRVRGRVASIFSTLLKALM
jgi:hypothetical protein